MNSTNSNSASSGDIPFVASSLVGMGSELLSRGDVDTALALFDSAHRMLAAPSASSISSAVKQIQMGTDQLVSCTENNNDCSSNSEDADFMNNSFSPSQLPDLYNDDSENDVGPRILSTPVRFDATAPLENSVVLLEAVTLFNKALVQHAKSQLFDAKQIYEHLVVPVRSLLLAAGSHPSNALLSLAMRVYNNLGLTSYADGQDEQALAYFQQALLVSKQLANIARNYCLEHSTVLSNLCRVMWVQGDVCDVFFSGLQEVLRIRSSLLSWDHPDVAAAHYNLATAEYTRHDNGEASRHLKQYLQVAAAQQAQQEAAKKKQCCSLDSIPAMIYLLLLQNEKKTDSMSQELVRGLHALQDKRQEDGPDSAEVASILNFIGTLLFHKADLDDALVFFVEELRLEEIFVEGDDDMSVSVTCNNIGRIAQERERYTEAVEYYQRALKPVYGNNNNSATGAGDLDYKACAAQPKKAHELNAASMNLYSTVWYNLGLIHDKNTEYAQAIDCFKMSLDLRRCILGRDHPDVACLHFNIGVLQTEQHHLTEAAASLKEALRARGNGTTACSDKLNDQRFIKTLEKLATLQKNKGNISAAVDAWEEALRIMEVSPEIDTASRIEYMALVLRSISELHHAAGDLDAALAAALQSGRKLEALIAAYGKGIDENSNKLAHIEQLVSSLLLVGSLHHEMAEPLKAGAILVQATLVLEHTARTHARVQPLPASLLALREVSSMLVTERCAPQA